VIDIRGNINGNERLRVVGKLGNDKMIVVVVELAAFEMVEIEEALDAICLAKQAVATVTSH
jgi:hypothetical protein